MKDTSESGNFKAFIAKIFSSINFNMDKITNLEQSRHYLETIFEENFKPERDFVEYLQKKKDRKWE